MNDKRVPADSLADGSEDPHLTFGGVALDTSPQLGQHGRKLARSVYSGPIAVLLRERIISGAVPAGTPLAEARLAQELSVSRGPVRNALQVLEGEGLVATLPNGRMVTVGFDDGDVDDLFDTRFVLESAAVSRAIARKADPAPLVAAFEAMVAEGTSTPRLVDLDIAFHLALLRLSGSRFLVHAWLASASVIHASITITNRRLAAEDPQSNFARIVESHEQLVDAIVARDEKLVASMLKQHFAFSASLFSERSSDGAPQRGAG